MGPVEALVQPLGAAWAGALLVSGLAFRRRAWLAGFTALCLAGGLWLVGGTPFPALLLSRLERPYDRIHPVTLPVADAVLLMVLSASASYIVVPAVLRHAMPQANPAIYLGLSLGLTFPFNILLGIPLYAEWARRFLG